MKDYSEMAHKSQEELKEAVKENLESFKAEKQKEVFADFDKMVAHLARTHALYQDEIARLLAAWFNAQPGCLRVNILNPTSDIKEGNKIKTIVNEAMTEVEEKAKAFTEAHKGEDSEKILAEMRGEMPVSENYENALNSEAITFLQEQQIVPNFYADIIMKAVKRGANWQKQQMIKDAVKVSVNGNDDGWLTLGYLPECEFDLRKGDEVKLVIIKEE